MSSFFGIPPQALFHGSQALAALEVPIEWHISQGVGHGIDQEGLRHHLLWWHPSVTEDAVDDLGGGGRPRVDQLDIVD